MKIEKEHIKYIQDEFATMQSREDFLDLLNYAKPLIYGDNYIPFELKQITYYANPKRSRKAYKEFQIKKKSGGVRTIYAPENGLKTIQKTIALILQCVFEPHEAAKGFVMGKSIVDNAKDHVGKNYVYNIDLKDFFPSIDQARVWACLKLAPFNLIDQKTSKEFDFKKLETGIRRFTTEFDEEIFYQLKGGTFLLVNDKKGNYKAYQKRLKKLDKDVFKDAAKYITTDANLKELEKLTVHREKLANMIASLSCTKMQVERKDENGSWVKVIRNVLPQGAPTSPVFSNIICQRLDKKLSGVAKRFHLNYTRYADDITFSSMHNVYQENGKFLKELTKVIKGQNFDIKESKTRLQKTGYRQEVTGLIVNDKVNVRKRYVKQVRMWLYYWEKYGYNKAESIFLKDYFIDKGHVKNAKPNFGNVLSGKLEYLKMVKGFENTTYLSLNKRFEKLLGVIDPIERILNEWENNGIDSAMKIYKTDIHE
ncbi:reverse transcriptase domain-containing protein [Polaribacter sp. Hel_I_88]|uniref:reverse transcriptase domain-containing protein n=1 Tax=Polaribacter sp. Hel_I_88 TaxID=1250006 RepID=UPI00068E45B9|nr:reverse transcriptase domain-containing protein [Polaribacter sp. Hel_I_88]